jgi:hypothetical protein
MRYRSPHRPLARAAIDELLGEAELLGLEGASALRHVYRGYPWGERRGHQYRIWLHEVELVVRGIDRPFTYLARRRKQGRAIADLPLFRRPSE